MGFMVDNPCLESMMPNTSVPCGESLVGHKIDNVGALGNSSTNLGIHGTTLDSRDPDLQISLPRRSSTDDHRTLARLFFPVKTNKPSRTCVGPRATMTLLYFTVNHGTTSGTIKLISNRKMRTTFTIDFKEAANTQRKPNPACDRRTRFRASAFTV